MAYSYGQLLRDYWFLLQERRGRFSFFAFLRLLSTASTYLIPLFLGLIVDFFTTWTKGDPITPIYWYAGGIAFVGWFNVWLRMVAKLQLQTLGAESRKKARLLAFRNLLALDLSWHEQELSGAKVQRINQGGESVYELMRTFTNAGAEIIGSFITIFIVYLAMDWKYIVYALVYAAIYFSGEVYFNRHLSALEKDLMKTKERVSGKLQERTTNLVTVKALGLQDQLDGHASAEEEEYFRTWERTRKARMRKSLTIKAFAGAGYGGFVLMTALDAVSGLITIGSIYIFSSYFGRLRTAMQTWSDNANKVIQDKAGVERVMGIINVSRKKDGGKTLGSQWQEIRLTDVWFRYKQHWVLRGFHLVLRKGESVGVVGLSGSGKSTLAKLLLRLVEPTKGSITIDGVALSEYSEKSLLEEMSVVLQEAELFNTTFVENITFASTPHKKKLASSMHAAQLDDVVKALPEKELTHIGEKGYKLSGGERQRVNIARALYKQPSLLIMDEATSHLDSKNELAIHASLEKMKQTSVLIAHRLSTLRGCDRIIVLEKGRIIEEGTFQTLLRKKGVFGKLYRLQREK